ASAGGVWMGGGGPAADGQGNVYITTGNGPWDGQTAFSDSIVKFSQTLQLEDYFTPFVWQYMDCADADLAAGGILLLPASGSTPMQALAGGKTGKLYQVNTGIWVRSKITTSARPIRLSSSRICRPRTRTPATVPEACRALLRSIRTKSS